MSHIGNKLRAGYFATPERQGSYLIELLNVQEDCSFFDPTCGEGAILHQLASAFRSEEVTISTYGVELDKRRAKKAKEVLDHCINAPIESMVVQNEVYSLLFLNPPYDHTMKGMEDEQSERKEFIELVRNTKYLKDRGLMIFIIPSYRFADKKIARFLSTHFNNVGVLRFSDEDYADFKQCIFIGNKRAEKRKDLNKKLFEFLLQMGSEDFVLKHVTPIELLVGNHKWNVPPGKTELSTFYSKLESKSNFYDGILKSKGFEAFKARAKTKELVIGGQPVLPINQGQMALLLASGAINGEIGEGDHYHLVQGLELVTKVRETEERVHENGSKTTIDKVRTKRDVSVKVITPSGLIRKLV